MTLLEEYKQKRRELDAKIKELENGRILRCGDARYEHRVYSSGRVDEIIAVNRPRELRGHKQKRSWWPSSGRRLRTCSSLLREWKRRENREED